MRIRPHLLLTCTLLGVSFAGPVFSQTPTPVPGSSKADATIARRAMPTVPLVCGACIRAHEEFLASDVMQGRGSATHDEWVAATYVASELRQYGIEPAEDGGYIQRAVVLGRKVTSIPTVTLTVPAEAGVSHAITWNQGKDFLTAYLSQNEFSGRLQKIDAAGSGLKVESGTVVLIQGSSEAQLERAALEAVSKGAVAELIPASPRSHEKFAEAAKQLPAFPLRLEGGPTGGQSEHFNMLQLSESAFQALAETPEGTVLHFGAAVEDERTYTWNAVGILPGRDPQLRHSAILLSAHLDHLGIGTPVKGDSIYNGADDDASGVAAVLELARVLGKGLRPRRTVIFALFGSEEIGGLGSTYFRDHPPVPLAEIAANLEFEMIGRPDSLVNGDSLWLTGWERSNLGPALAAHGAHLVGDPHPEQVFFARSDNYILAKKGVVAQTVSSFGLHKDYHQPSDDVAHLDFKHMNAAIGSFLRPVEWLVNSDFTPEWNPGGQP